VGRCCGLNHGSRIIITGTFQAFAQQEPLPSTVSIQLAGFRLALT